MFEVSCGGREEQVGEKLPRETGEGILRQPAANPRRELLRRADHSRPKVSVNDSGPREVIGAGVRFSDERPRFMILDSL